MSELYEKIRETCKQRVPFKQRYSFFADTPNIAGNLALFDKIYDGQPILFVFSVIGEDPRMYIPLFQVNAVFANTYYIQLTETPFAE